MITVITDKRRLQLQKAQQAYRLRHPDRVKEQRAKYLEDNPERYKLTTKNSNAKQRKLNADKLRLANKQWRENNKDYIANTNAIRRQQHKDQTPVLDKELTAFVFQEARSLCKLRERVFGFKWHVDHIVPLKSGVVCGFHHWNNLQVIPAVVNMQKHNTLNGDFSWL